MAKQSIKKNSSDSTDWEPSKALISDVEKGITKAKYIKYMTENCISMISEAEEEQEYLIYQPLICRHKID